MILLVLVLEVYKTVDLLTSKSGTSTTSFAVLEVYKTVDLLTIAIGTKAEVEVLEVYKTVDLLTGLLFQ